MARLRRFNVALALLVLLVMAWQVVTLSPDPAEIKKALDQSQGDKTRQTDLLRQHAQAVKTYEDLQHADKKDRVIQALKTTDATGSQHGSPLWYKNWGYSKLGSVSKHDDTISACGKRTLDSHNKAWYVAAGAWNNETRKWHVSIDSNPGDGVCVPNITKANHELHRTCITKARGHATRCGKRRSYHRG